MAKDTRSSGKTKSDAKNDTNGKHICTRSSTCSGSTSQATSGLRRSSRDAPSEKPIVLGPSTHNSERHEKQANTPALVTRNLERIEKKNMPNHSKRSERVINLSSPSSTRSKNCNRNSGSSDVEQKKEKKEKIVEESKKETKPADIKMTARAYSALFRRMPKNSELLSDSVQGMKDGEPEQVDMGECYDNSREDAEETCLEQSPSRSTHPNQKDCHVDEANVSVYAKGMEVANSSSLASGEKDNAEKFLADSPQTESIESPKLVIGETSLERENGRSPSKRKRKRVDHDVMELRDCSSVANPDRESDCTVLNKDRGEVEAGTTLGLGENNDEFMQQNVSHDCKSDSSYVEYWVPVQISNMQLEQYCATLLSNSSHLCSQTKNDPVGAVCSTLISVRKSCDHPYVVDQSLRLLLTKGLEEVEYLDVDIKASGKLQLLEAMLLEVRKRGSKAVVLFQTIGGGGRDLIGDILGNFMCQRFGPTSYERIERDLISTRKQSALNKFNNESERFVLLLETNACSPSIKLSSVEAFFIFVSNWSPRNDLRALQKIKVDSPFGKTKIFRLYSSCTVEEKILILARQNKNADSSPQNLSLANTHALLMWGASYLFDKLDQFHNNPTSSTSVLFGKPLLENVVNEFLAILFQDGGGKYKGKLQLILEAKHGQGTYSTDSALLGEQKIKLTVEDRSNVFWSKLLKGKSPKWKYSVVSSVRNRKRVQYCGDSERSPEGDNYEAAKKPKKVVDDSANTPPQGDGIVVIGESTETPRSPSVAASQSPPRSASDTNDTTHGNDSSGMNSLCDNISEVPKGMLVGNIEQTRLAKSQKSLHSCLKPEIAKLCEVLHLSENVRNMAENFLEYIVNNHHVSRDSATKLQAFQISLCWVAASLLKHKVSHKESLVLVKEFLNFGCTKEEVEYIYSMLYCLRSVFFESLHMHHQQKQNINREDQLPVLDSGLQLGLQLAQKDLAKSVKDIQKKCRKQMTKLAQKQKEEKEECERQYEEEKSKLERQKKVEAAVIRRSNVRIAVDKLKKIDSEYAIKLEELKCKMDERLENQEVRHVTARKKLTQKEARWIESVRSWAEAEFINHSSGKQSVSLPCSGTLSLGTCKNALCNNANDTETATAELGAMISDRNRENTVAMDPSAKTLHTRGTILGGDTQPSVSEFIALNTCEKDILPVLSSEQQVHGDAIGGKPGGQAASTEPEIVTLNIPLLKSQVPNEFISATPDEGFSLRVSKVVLSSVTPENGASASPLLSGERVPATATLCTPEMVATEATCRPCTGGGKDHRSNEQDEEFCVHQESPAVESAQTEIPAIASELHGSVAPPQAVRDACSLPSSLAGNQPEPLTTEVTQNISEAAEFPISEPGNCTGSDEPNCEAEIAKTDVQVEPLPSRDASSGHDLPTDGECITRSSNEDILLGQNSQTLMQQMENNIEIAHEEAVSQLPVVVSEDLSASTCVGGSTACVSADISVSNNCVALGLVPSSLGLPLPLYGDAFQNELEKIRRDSEQMMKIHEEKTLRLKDEWAREMAQINIKYESKLQELDTEFHAKKKEADANQSYVLSSKILADAFKSKCADFKASATNYMQREANSSLVQQLVQLSTQHHAQRPSTITARPSVASTVAPSPPTASPLPRFVGSPFHSPNYPLHPPRPPLIVSTSPSTGNLHLGSSSGRLRAPAPHLQPFRPSSVCVSTNSPNLTSVPLVTPNHHSLNSRSTASPSLAHHFPRAPSPAYQSAIFRNPRPETVGRSPSLADMRMSAVELLVDVSNQARANPNSNFAASKSSYLDTVLQQQQQQQQQHGLQVNSLVEVSGSPEVISLLDDE